MFTAVRKVGSYAQPFSTGEWFGVDADGSKARSLIFYGTRDATQRGKQIGNERFSMLDPLEEDASKVLMAVSYPLSKEGSGTELVEVDTYTGKRKSLARAPAENCQLALDEKKQARFAVCYDDENEHGEYDVSSELYRREADGKWTLVNKADANGTELRVYGAGADGRIYAFQDDRKKPAAFGVLDRHTGEFKTLFQDPVAEVGRLLMASDGEHIIGVITEAGAPKVELIDEEHADAQLYMGLAKSFPGQLIDFTSATSDGNQIVVAVGSDRNPGELYLYDRKEGKARFLLANREQIDPKKMASVKPFKLAARDGLALHGYLTLPHATEAKNLPLIVNPHGGPMGPRDHWNFNWETQLLASRGYAVLQVNYRGSGGFGKGFQDQAFGQWAQGIQNDIIDATRWAVEQGYADAERICIYGGSFGGYSALMAPAREPGMFKCAFGYVGLYDSAIQFDKSDTGETESGIRYLKRAFGNTEAEQHAMSPINHVEKLDLPIALAAGARDRRCPPEHTEAMRDALVKAGNPPEEVIIQSGEMHGFYKVDNRVKLYTSMLAFFDRHIGSKGEVEVGKLKVEGKSAP